MTQNAKRVRVAVPVPVADGFDYRWDRPGPRPAPGTRVCVPFGKRRHVGVVIDAKVASVVDDAALKPVGEVLDDSPLFDRELLASLRWAAGYYHHPLGDVLLSALPTLLRQGRAAEAEPEPAWQVAAEGLAADREVLARRAPKQALALGLVAGAGVMTAAALRQHGVTADTIRRLADKAWLAPAAAGAAGSAGSAAAGPKETPPELTRDQQLALGEIREADGFAVSLLFGVTGSGKTEVFLRLISEALDRDRQCLLLVPEIGLTPQLVRRLEARFRCRLAVFHSGLTARERLTAWREARSGDARLVVGTRSAAFAPLPEAGLIVVDEEHDPSYKQQSGFRYSGRDLAIMRAKALSIPVVLASATPSLESFHNAVEGRYRLVQLPRRIGAGGEPRLRTIDLNRHAVRRGLSTPLLAAIDRHIGRGNQVLLFINRRGFAPVLFCPGCARASECARCDARMTIHARAGELRCHHCGRRETLQWACPDCGGERIGVGAGTERVTAELEALYPDQAIARLDRDTVAGRDALGAALDAIESGAARIIVGTQLLTKGHDFPRVTLVGVLNADQGLFGTDFRSEERLAQTIVQVAGRAGRRDEPGEVLIQTHYPGHPLLKSLLERDYAAFASHALTERRETGWPPFSHLAVFRAEAVERDRVYAFLERLRREAESAHRKLRVLGPAAAGMERREGRYRAQLLLRSTRRPELHATIAACLEALAAWRETRRVRWSVDVDPAEL